MKYKFKGRVYILDFPEPVNLFSGEKDNHGTDIYFGDKYTWTAFMSKENQTRTEHLKDFTDISHLRTLLEVNKTVKVIDPKEMNDE
jgi:hypothetical protein